MYNSLFIVDERFEYCELESRFYKVDREKTQVSEVDFDEMLVDYLTSKNSKLFKKFLGMYVRLCMKTIGFNEESVKTYKDLDAITELYFKDGANLEDE